MPTYDYQCQACDHTFEAFQSITAKPLKRCPECGKQKLARLIGTGAGIIFKGSGFYETDYRSEGYKKAEKAENDSAKPQCDSSKDGKAGSDTGGSKSNSTGEAKETKAKKSDG